MKGLEALSCMSVTGSEAKNICKAASIQFVVQNPKGLVDGHCPLCVYHLSTLMSLHVTKSPRPSPSVFVCCKQSNTRGGNSLGMRLEFLSSRWLPLVTSEVFGSIHITYVCVLIGTNCNLAVRSHPGSEASCGYSWWVQSQSAQVFRKVRVKPLKHHSEFAYQ